MSRRTSSLSSVESSLDVMLVPQPASNYFEEDTMSSKSGSSSGGSDLFWQSSHTILLASDYYVPGGDHEPHSGVGRLGQEGPVCGLWCSGSQVAYPHIESQRRTLLAESSSNVSQWQPRPPQDLEWEDGRPTFAVAGSRGACRVQPSCLEARSHCQTPDIPTEQKKRFAAVMEDTIAHFDSYGLCTFVDGATGGYSFCTQFVAAAMVLTKSSTASDLEAALRLAQPEVYSE